MQRVVNAPIREDADIAHWCLTLLERRYRGKQGAVERGQRNAPQRSCLSHKSAAPETWRLPRQVMPTFMKVEEIAKSESLLANKHSQPRLISGQAPDLEVQAKVPTQAQQPVVVLALLQ